MPIYSFDLKDFEGGKFIATRYPDNVAVSGDWVCTAASDVEALALAREAAYYEWQAPSTRDYRNFSVCFLSSNSGGRSPGGALIPLPDDIDDFRSWSSPFIGCFGSSEKQFAAAMYVEFCRQNGNVWQPVKVSSALILLSRMAEESPAYWAKFYPLLGKLPDVLGMVEAGYFQWVDGKGESIVLTDSFLEKVGRYVRYVCSPTRPMPKGAEGRWSHTNAEETLDFGETCWMKCRDCQVEWKEELPQ